MLSSASSKEIPQLAECSTQASIDTKPYPGSIVPVLLAPRRDQGGLGGPDTQGPSDQLGPGRAAYGIESETVHQPVYARRSELVRSGLQTW